MMLPLSRGQAHVSYMESYMDIQLQHGLVGSLGGRDDGGCCVREGFFEEECLNLDLKNSRLQAHKEVGRAG